MQTLKAWTIEQRGHIRGLRDTVRANQVGLIFVGQVAEAIDQVSKALQHIHALGWIYADVKPESARPDSAATDMARHSAQGPRTGSATSMATLRLRRLCASGSGAPRASGYGKIHGARSVRCAMATVARARLVQPCRNAAVLSDRLDRTPPIARLELVWDFDRLARLLQRLGTKQRDGLGQRLVRCVGVSLAARPRIAEPAATRLAHRHAVDRSECVLLAIVVKAYRAQLSA